MAVAASFALIFAIPFALGVAAGRIRAPWYSKLAIGASYPAVIALTLTPGSPTA
jgi:hypothetical protein